MAEPIELSPRYYRDNFLRLCDSVEDLYGDLLLATEAAVLDGFRSLPDPALCLYVRLVSRTGPWFRESRLHYEEIGPIAPALDALLETGMAVAAGALDGAQLGALFTRAELEAAFAGRLDTAGYPDKAGLLAAIERAVPDGAGRIGLAAAQTGERRIVAPAHAGLVERLQVLFFGNRHQGLTEFVLEDLGVTRYYPYPLERSRRLFADRDALDEYLACAALADAYRELLDTGGHDQLPALADALLAMQLAHAPGARRWDRLANHLARDLERLGEDQRALALYARSRRHPARERTARILERRGDWQAALAACNAILAEPRCEAEQEAALRILPRVERGLGRRPPPRPRDSFDELHLVLPAGAGPVELRTAAHLQAHWSAVHWVENGLMNALFGLAFWEEIFAPVPGVFHHPYQAGPADMYDSGFRRARAGAVAARLDYLRGADLAATLAAACRDYHPCQCRWVDWRRVDPDLVGETVRCVPREHLLAIFERLLFDPGENRRGFPDLIALGDAPGRYAMIEVKGPGDALQDSQKRWLRFFRAHDIPAQVAWVEWRDG